MSRILIVDDSRSFSLLLRRRVREELGFETVAVESLAQVRTALAATPDFLAALVDLNLPDAPDGQAVDAVLAAGVPAIVFTGQLSDKLREAFWSRRIVDYLLKDGRANVDYVIELLARLEKNPETKILVVDDSRSFRFALSRLLAAHRYQVLEASCGREALSLLERYPDVRLVTVDAEMPDMDGADLVRAIRREFSRDAVAVIGISGKGDERLSVRFLKSGANDFLPKSFQAEEFYTRVALNLEMLDHVAQIRDMAEHDQLTRVYNRHYFFKDGGRLLALARRRSLPVALAMLDIDQFKRINDTLGHNAGDAALNQMAVLLASRFRGRDVVARLGGDEFCVLAVDMPPEAALAVFEALRACLAATPAVWRGARVPYTVSIGVCRRPDMDLDEMLAEADRLLYVAKTAGRNRVCAGETDRATN